MTGRRESEATATLYADQGEELADLRKRLDRYKAALRQIAVPERYNAHEMAQIARAALSGAPEGEG